jgi:glycerol dehydrogenase-like iron-containing ADH family enzyme
MISIPAAAAEDGKFSSIPPTTYTKKEREKKSMDF